MPACVLVLPIIHGDKHSRLYHWAKQKIPTCSTKDVFAIRVATSTGQLLEVSKNKTNAIRRQVIIGLFVKYKITTQEFNHGNVTHAWKSSLVEVKCRFWTTLVRSIVGATQEKKARIT